MIQVLVTGGTFDKEYNYLTGELYFKNTHLPEMLDKGRRGMASTFLTRLRLGPVLVDAKGVHRLYEGRVQRREVAMILGAGVVAFAAIFLFYKPLQVFWHGLWELWLRDWLT